MDDAWCGNFHHWITDYIPKIMVFIKIDLRISTEKRNGGNCYILTVFNIENRRCQIQVYQGE